MGREGPRVVVREHRTLGSERWNFCEVDSVRVFEDSIPEMLATLTDIRFKGNVVSSFI